MGRRFGAGMRNLALSLLLLIATVFAPAPSAQTQDESWPVHVSLVAAYQFEYPPESVIETSSDAALRYPVVYVNFPSPDGAGYQGASVMVFENSANSDARAFALERDPALTSNARSERGRLTLERDIAVGDGDARSTLVPGNGVIYRINLFGGGVGGEVEPTPRSQAFYARLVRSFKVLDQPLRPAAVRAQARAAPASAAAADVFGWPLRDANGVSYGVPVGIVLDRTRLEWLDYGIRNLDQWRLKCYGVDWSRMIHTGEDWYRLDFLTRNTAGTPVHAVADGVVVRHNPGISYPGNVVVVQHTLPEGGLIYSMYGHVNNVSVVVGDAVVRGQQIATVLNQSYVGRTPGRHPSWDSHLHFEMRKMMDAGNIYVPGTNAYGYNYPGCTWLYPGRGYTYRVHPNNYPYPDNGYVDPSDFIAARLAPGERPPLAEDARVLAVRATGVQTDTLTNTLTLPMVVRAPEIVCTELVGNPGFETNGEWAGIANTSGAIYNEAVYSTGRARSGLRAGLVGSLRVNGYWNEIVQTVQVPPGTVSATLTLWRNLATGETSTTAAYDVFRIGVETDKGIEIITPRRVDNTSAGRNTWVRETLPISNIGAFAGQLLWVTVKGNTDGNRPSGLYVDDVGLEACGAG
jgi:murein DD-endopeptidase MepM/ murein hydrolase activator NlpD